MTKPIDQQEAMDQLYRANIERAKAAAKDHQKVMFGALVHGAGFSLDGKHVPHSDVYVVPADAPMVPGRKLTEALLEAGMKHGHEDIKFVCSPEFGRADPVDVVSGKPLFRLSVVDEAAPSFIRTIGSIAWRLLVVMVVVGVTVAVLAGGRV